MLLNLKKEKNKQSLKIDPGSTQKKLGMLNVIYNLLLYIFVALHFVQYDVLSALVNIAFQCSITHHITLNVYYYIYI